MKCTNGDMPAMPNNNPETYPTPCPLQWGYGITKRELFAMAAMQGFASKGVYDTPSDAAHDAVRWADALLAELDKDGGGS